MRYSESCREAFSRKGWPEGAFEAIHGGKESLVDNDIAVFISNLFLHFLNCSRGAMKP